MTEKPFNDFDLKCPIHNIKTIATMNDGGTIIYGCGCYDGRKNNLLKIEQRKLFSSREEFNEFNEYWKEEQEKIRKLKAIYEGPMFRI